MFETPILLLIFNRQDTTQQVFNAIRQQKPKYLYVAADGPRPDKEGESEKCRHVRDIIQQIDWDCELKTLFRDENLGCKMAVSTAISWFFEQVEYGIILEDDCLPNPSFFQFCEELLIKYKDDDRVGHIAGSNFLPGLISKNLSYDFCSTVHIWGWASWKRVWKNYDVSFPYWPQYKDNKESINNLFNNRSEKIYFSSFLSDTLANKNRLSVWDAQYFFTLRIQNQLAIYPGVNLVTNIGLGSEEATHTTKKSHNLYVLAEKMTFPLKHPQYIMRNKTIDNQTIKEIFFSWRRIIRFYLHKY